MNGLYIWKLGLIASRAEKSPLRSAIVGTVNCAGSNGLIAAQIKIRKGTGTGDFFWNIALDDSGGNNLARWYGGSAYARGRVGNNITADMPLTGPAWTAVGGREPRDLQADLAAERASPAQPGFFLALGLGKAAQDYLA